eukprot:gene5326-5562_t
MGKGRTKRKAVPSSSGDELDVRRSVEQVLEKQGNKRGHKRARASSVAVRVKAASLAGQRVAKTLNQSAVPKKTSDTYATFLRKWEFFLNHDKGQLREKPWNGSLLSSEGRETAGKFLLWLSSGAEGYKPKSGRKSGRKSAELLSQSALDVAHSALSGVYKDQREAASPADVHGLPDRLMADARYSLAYKSVKNTITKKADRSMTIDPQRNTISDAYTEDEHMLLMEAMLGAGTAVFDRMLAMASWAHTSIGRSDDVRLFFLADIIAPRKIPAVGPHNCYILPIVLKGGKTDKSGKPAYSGCIRHRVPELCPIRALAYHLMHRFTIENVPFPDPRDTTAWLSAALFPGKSSVTENISYDVQYRELKELLTELDMSFSKVTHIFRVSGAQELDLYGVDDSVILRMGKWLHQAMYTHYLSFFKTEGLLAMGRWPHAQKKDFSHFWHERFEMDIPSSMLSLVFPFLPELKKQLEEVPKVLPSMTSVVDVLEFLAVVLVTDAVDLLSRGKFMDHPVHRLLLDDPVFGELVEEYKEKKAASAFEVTRPRTTKEITTHNNQLLQDLPKLLQHVMQGGPGGRPIAAWSEQMREQPAAPRPTPEEQEAEADAQIEVLLRRTEELEKRGDMSEADEGIVLPAHTMFPNLPGSGPARFRGQPSKYGAALSGNSQLLPNPADWMQQDHRVAPPGITLNVPGIPVPVPLHAAQLIAAEIETMEKCSEIVTEAYSIPLNCLQMFDGDLPPGHRSTDRRQRYAITEHNGDLIVALPGTTHPFDWSSNLRVHYTPVDGSMPPAGTTMEQLNEVPLFANSALVQMIEENGWEESFVNVVVPEDYCLKLFNNVLTSAPQPDSLSRSGSSCCNLKTPTKQQLEYAEFLDDPFDQEPVPASPLADPFAYMAKAHKRVLQPLAYAAQLPGSSLSLVSSLLPSRRTTRTMSKVALRAASAVSDRALSIPLAVLESGLIRALKPPMYQPVGQQWVLSVTGLVPQSQPITQYPRHVHDVFWHKELVMVAFREHSIVFYKQRLLQQARRR